MINLTLMKLVGIRIDVTEDVHWALKQRAANSKMKFREWLVQTLAEIAYPDRQPSTKSKNGSKSK